MEFIKHFYDNYIALGIDICLFIVILISVIMGWRQGIIAAIFNLVRWVVCVGVSLFAAKPVLGLIREHTGLADSFASHVESLFSTSWVGNKFFNLIPEQLRGGVSEFSEESAAKLAANLSETIMLVLCFFLVFVAALIITKIIVSALESIDSDDPGGFTNGLCGGLFGLIRGVLAISILLMIVFPLSSVIDPDASTPVVAGIRESLLCSALYDHNPITYLLELLH